MQAQTRPGGDPSIDPAGEAGALKAQVETAGSYSAYSGSASRSVVDLHIPGAVGDGLDFTRHWNSVNAPDADRTAPFGPGGWTHSWNWSVQWGGSEIVQPDGAPVATWTVDLEIRYPDGSKSVFWMHRDSVNDPCNDGLCWAPPYDSDFVSPGGVLDRIRQMEDDGSKFWLFRADGSSVFFDTLEADGQPAPLGSLGVGQFATKMIDKNGLLTTLKYLNGRLDEVLGPDGRTLRVGWGSLAGWPNPVIRRVETGTGFGLQAVEYGYGWIPSANNMQVALTEVRYLGDIDPQTGTDVSARYDYLSYESPTIHHFSGVMLTRADDPRFAGAMTRIRYRFWGMDAAPCIPSGQPFNNHDFYVPSVYSLLQEQSDAEQMVSAIAVPCNGAGTRTESRGGGGSRIFYYGRSAGNAPDGTLTNLNAPPNLSKLTDFSDTPATAPADFQLHFASLPFRVFDARGISTDLVRVPLYFLGGPHPPYSGRVAEVKHTGSDASKRTYNWTEPDADSEEQSADVPNDVPHWLFSQKDENLFETVYSRDGRRRVKKIRYHDGTVERFTYNQFNQVLKHTLASGAERNYEYDARGLLQREWNNVEGFEARKEYSYDVFDRVWTMQDGRARSKNKPFSARMTYNARHQVTAVEYPDDLATPLPPEDCEKCKTETDPPVAPYPTVFYEYDSYGNCTAITDELGHRRTYQYDEYRRCIAATEPLNAPGWNGSGTVASRTWNWFYDRFYSVSGTINVYASADRLTSTQWRIQQEPAFNAAGERRMTVRAYDHNDRLTAESTGWIATGPSTWHYGPDGQTHYFDYDNNGNKDWYKDPRGRITTYEYDLRNRLEKTIEPPAQQGEQNRITKTAYDFVGNKQMVTFPDQRTQRWEAYDPFGQAWRFFDERNNRTDLTYEWGPMKKLGTVTTHRTMDSGGLENQTTTFESDGLGRPRKTIFPGNQTYEEATYENGAMHTWRTRKGDLKTIEYDSRGREIAHTWSDGTPGVTRIWDHANRLVSLCNVFSSLDYAYDDAGQLRWEGNYLAGAPARVQTDFFRYPSGEVAHVRYPGGFWLRRDYTARGQLQAVGTDDASGNWTAKLAAYTYLPDGKVDHVDNANGAHTDYFYDGRAMIERMDIWRGTPNGPQRHTLRTYGRDRRDRIQFWTKSNLTSHNPMENGRGDAYIYDDEGQLKEAYYDALGGAAGAAPSITTHPLSQNVAVGEQATFNVTATGDSLSFQWKRDDVSIADTDRSWYTTPPAAAADHGTRYTVVVTNSVGSATSTPATLSVTSGQSSPGRVETVNFATEEGPDETILLYMHTGTADAIIFYKTSPHTYPSNPTHSGSSPGPGTLRYSGPITVYPGARIFYTALAYKEGMEDSTPSTFEVDIRGGEDPDPGAAGRTEKFYYDELGNRMNGPGAAPIFRRDNGLNQYESWNAPANTINYEQKGVLTQEGLITGVYNALNQPISISAPGLPGGTYLWFGFDPLGRCVKRWTGASSAPATNPATYLHYDGWNLIQEGPSATNAERIYVHGGRVDEIVASKNIATGEWSYLHYDARGHTILLTDGNGALVEQYEYDAFGKPYFFDGAGQTLASSALGNRFLFTGREWLSELKIYDYRHRLYHPELGRFLQPDPKHFEAGDYNIYRYCHNDPVNKSDPFGLEVHDRDFEPVDGKEIPGKFGNTEFSVSVSVGVVPGANGTFSLQVIGLDITVTSKKVALTANGAQRRPSAIEATKTHEKRHVDNMRRLDKFYERRVVKTGLTRKEATLMAAQREADKVADKINEAGEADQRDCKKPTLLWKPIVSKER